MSGRVLRLAPTSPGGRVREVPIGPGQLRDAERLLVRLSRLESVRSGDRTAEIVCMGGER
ncbi:hypothetical protein [Verrucosispora sp. NA02020]|uniref:hypothetical protein n=1 Tax=Verrucosispora sp. NA02020 TaxID=2742132 RepID=UPI001591347C|nr:hypothetical protein [Verrucosispora sp. NA02020]QKW15312.1 hypothetical protein HUT12_22835 [Verrucosispora sp. NA02020]